MSGVRTRLIVGVASAACLALSACGGSDKADKKSGSIAFCTGADAPPITFQEGGGFKGYESDIAREVAKRMGKQANITLVSFDAFIGAVQSGKCDVFYDGVSNTPERAAQVHFTDTVNIGQQYLASKDTAAKIKSEDDLCGLSVSVLIGSTNKTALDDQSKKCKAAGKKALDVQVFSKDSDAGQALVQGKVDAFGSDSPALAYYLTQTGDRLAIAPPEPLRKQPQGMVARKDNTELNAALSKQVDAMYADGTMTRILASYKLPSIALK